MAAQTAFAPYRLPPGALPEEALRLALRAGVEPLVVCLDEPLPTAMVGAARAGIPAGRAGAPEEACRAADGTPSGAPGPLRACLVSRRQRARIEHAVSNALAAGFAGVCLDEPDAPLAQGVLGSGFCPDCQRDFSRELTREYGDHFMPVDYLALARAALARASGAIGFAHLPFGRDFWRFRMSSLDRAVAGYARAARDCARAGDRPFEVTAQYGAMGPAQFASARHLDAAIFPLRAEPHSSSAATFRLLRAAMGRRPCAAVLKGPVTLATAQRLAALAAACGVELIGEPADAASSLASLRRFARLIASRRHAPRSCEPVIECALLYSAEADMWSGGDHREQVERAGDALAALQVQAPVVMRAADAPTSAILVLAGATGLPLSEALELRRRIEGGGSALVLGDLVTVDETWREAASPLPPVKPATSKVGKGAIVGIKALASTRAGAHLEAAQLEPLGRTLGILIGRGRRAVSTAGRAPIFVTLYRNDTRLDAHLISLGPEPAQGTTLFIGLHLAGLVRRARFQSESGADETIVMNPSGSSISTVLPAFQGYAVLSIGG